MNLLSQTYVKLLFIGIIDNMHLKIYCQGYFDFLQNYIMKAEKVLANM